MFILIYVCITFYETGLSEARQRMSLTPQLSPGFTPSGTPKILSTGASPRSYSATSSPKLFSGAASPTSSHYDIRMWSSSSQQSSVANSPTRSHSTSGYNLSISKMHLFANIISYDWWAGGFSSHFSHPPKLQFHYLLYSSTSAN